MNKILFILTTQMFFFLVLVNPTRTFAEKIEEIKSLYNNINNIITTHKATEILFYTDGDGYSQGKWYKVININEKDLFNKSYFRAKSYLYKGKIIKTIIVIDSPVGDWTNIKEYYFYNTEATAFVFEKHVTSQAHNVDTNEPLPPGPYILERRIYFDETGKELRLLEKAYISSTNKRIPVKFVRQIDFGFDVYMNVNFLPFSKMLKR
jgi:hypothetical protein